MTLDELRNLLQGQPDNEFIERHVLNRRPWIFDNDETYDRWRGVLASELAIEPHCVHIVGSAATGYSLSPLKPGRPFRDTSLDTPHSDIDIALIDRNLFVQAWDTILSFDRTRRLGGSLEARSKIRVDVYWGTVGEQSLPRNTEQARILLTAMAVAGDHRPFVDIASEADFIAALTIFVLTMSTLFGNSGQGSPTDERPRQ